MKRKHITSTRYSDEEIGELQRRALSDGFTNLQKWEREHIHKFEPIKAGAPKGNKNRANSKTKSTPKPD